MFCLITVWGRVTKHVLSYKSCSNLFLEPTSTEKPDKSCSNLFLEPTSTEKPDKSCSNMFLEPTSTEKPDLCLYCLITVWGQITSQYCHINHAQICSWNQPVLRNLTYFVLFYYSLGTGNYLVLNQKIHVNNLLEDPMFAVVFILEYVIGEQLSAEDRRVRFHNTIYKK